MSALTDDADNWDGTDPDETEDADDFEFFEAEAEPGLTGEEMSAAYAEALEAAVEVKAEAYAKALARTPDRPRLDREAEKEFRRLVAQGTARQRLRDEEPDAYGEPAPPSDASFDAGPVLPDVGERSDGVGVFYSNKINVVFGESEGGKTWLALHAAQQVMEDGGEVWFLDYEDDERAIVQRLLAIGVDRETIRQRFHYLNPEGRFTDKTYARLRDRLPRVRMVVVDATTEALAAEGLDSNSDVDIARFYNGYLKRIAALGPAVVLVDHVTKSVEGRTQQIGSQMKKAGIDGVSYSVEPMETFTKGHGGASMVCIGKDKQGGVRERGVFGGEGRQARFARFWMSEFGTTRLDPVPAAESKTDKAVKHAVELREAILQFCAEHPGTAPSERAVFEWLRQERGLKFTATDARDILREIKAGREVAGTDA